MIIHGINIKKEKFEELVYKCALINATKHGGKADINAVTRMVHNEIMKIKHGVVG